MDADITLRIDGHDRRPTVDTRTSLLDALRERLGNTRIINARTARSQFLGGMTMGLSMALAVWHATGVRVRDLPVTLDKVLAALP